MPLSYVYEKDHYCLKGGRWLRRDRDGLWWLMPNGWAPGRGFGGGVVR